MNMPRKLTLLAIPLALIALLYIGAALMLARQHDPIAVLDEPAASHEVIAIFGASGTAGDGILKAALADPDIQTIHVITRRPTPRIEQGVAAGKVRMSLHQVSTTRESRNRSRMWTRSIGRSASALLASTKKPAARFMSTIPPVSWRSGSLSAANPTSPYHYISSSDISEDSSAMWAREKVRAEQTLFKLVEGTRLRVIA